MLRIHKEGRVLLIVLGILLISFNASIYFVVNFIIGTPSVMWVVWAIFIISLGFYGLILQFFRNPVRKIPVLDNKLVYAPADGKVVVIEETVETEYFKDRRIQISIFMSPLNVHVNRNPISGLIKYYRYHEGKYLVAWHPKASTENERTTVVIGDGKREILFRQIAGAVAKRIKAYVKEGDKVTQGDDMGFIKFGSRVDIYLPLDAHIKIGLNTKAIGNQTVIAELP